MQTESKQWTVNDRVEYDGQRGTVAEIAYTGAFVGRLMVQWDGESILKPINPALVTLID